MTPVLCVLSLGAGVQSTTLALMAAHGEITPMPDVAIFADTQSEPLRVYSHLARLQAVLPFPVEIVTVGSLKADLMRGTNTGARKRFAAIPYFLDRLEQGKADGGQGRRQCTREYKIDPITKRCRELLSYAPRQRIPPGSIEQWIGISTDEAHRMKSARVAWQINRYPLVEQGMSRGDCLAWLDRHHYERPGKSASTFCPYRSNESWPDLKRNDPASWDEAVAVDAALRANQHELRLRATPYLHRSLKPLPLADLSENQPDLFGNECEGVCGV